MTDPGTVAVLAGRIGYAAVLVVLAAGNLRSLPERVAYARNKGVPLASVAVLAGSLLLVAGAASLALGVYPVAGALAVVAFLLPVTPLMHDFWTMEGQRREAEFAQFLKNVALLGAALALAGTGPALLGGGLA